SSATKNPISAGGVPAPPPAHCAVIRHALVRRVDTAALHRSGNSGHAVAAPSHSAWPDPARQPPGPAAPENVPGIDQLLYHLPGGALAGGFHTASHWAFPIRHHGWPPYPSPGVG